MLMMVGGWGMPGRNKKHDILHLHLLTLTCNLNMSFAEPNLILSFTSEVSKLSIGQVPDGQLVGVVVGPALPACHMVLVMADLYLTTSGQIEPFHLGR